MLLRKIVQMTKACQFSSVLSKNGFTFSDNVKFDLRKDYYTLLQLPKDANDAQIESSFQRLSLLCHSDINPANLGRYNEFVEARTILTNQKLRKQYDEERLFGKYTKEVNSRFESLNQQPYESRTTDRGSFELKSQEEDVDQKTNRWIKSGLIVLVGFAIFFPFAFWKVCDRNTLQHYSDLRPSAVYLRIYFVSFAKKGKPANSDVMS